jgi:2-polyprenyl-6-methoxyphenol hydroxylase-like FAD-dependent oxidoreductase
MAHAYKFSRDTSTFIAELPETTWRAAELDRADEARTLVYLEEVFADDLGGARLISNRSRWIQFLLVKCRRWVHENVVLLGDAAHTAHFSIGSGTKLAMEDAIALYESFAPDRGDAAGALARFERTRKPVVDAYQEAAYSSTLWFEGAAAKLALDPVPFAFDCMTRSGKIDLENLRRRDPAFVAQYEEWRARAS